MFGKVWVFLLVVLLGTMDLAWGKWEETRKKNEELYRALKEQFCPKEIASENELTE